MIDWQKVLKDLDDMYDYFMGCAANAAPGSKARETFTGYMVTLNMMSTEVSALLSTTITCDTAGAKPPEAHFAGEEDKPHKVSMVVCLNCGKRWVAVRPLGTKLTDLECPQCHTQGAATETGEELEDDGK